jgi:hypothetical protein
VLGALFRSAMSYGRGTAGLVLDGLPGAFAFPLCNIPTEQGDASSMVTRSWRGSLMISEVDTSALLRANLGQLTVPPGGIH